MGLELVFFQRHRAFVHRAHDGIHAAAWRRIHDHEGAIAEQGLAAIGVNTDATQALATVDTIDEVVEFPVAEYRAAHGRAGELQGEADGCKTLLGREIGAHHAAHRDIGQETDGTDVGVAMLVFAVTALVYLDADAPWRNLGEAYAEEVAGIIEAWSAIEGEPGEYAAAKVEHGGGQWGRCSKNNPYSQPRL